MKLLLLDKANRFPPIACRLLARHHFGGNKVKAMTDTDIAIRSGLNIADVKHISWSLSWDDINFGDMMKFMRGCGIDWDDPACFRRNSLIVKGSRLLFLRKSPLWDSQFKEMARHWLQHAKR